MHLEGKSCEKDLNAKVISLLQQPRALLVLKTHFSSFWFILSTDIYYAAFWAVQ